MPFVLSTLSPEDIYKSNKYYHFDKDSDFDDPLPIKTHGLHAYKVRNCRCDICKQAAVEHRQKRLAVQRQRQTKKVSAGMEG